VLDLFFRNVRLMSLTIRSRLPSRCNGSDESRAVFRFEIAAIGIDWPGNSCLLHSGTPTKRSLMWSIRFADI
jgi:hypothetical protein